MNMMSGVYHAVHLFTVFIEFFSLVFHPHIHSPAYAYKASSRSCHRADWSVTVQCFILSLVLMHSFVSSIVLQYYIIYCWVVSLRTVHHTFL